MDPQAKQKFFLFTGAIILVVLAIILTPYDPPKLPISLLGNEVKSTNLIQDENFSFAGNSWMIQPSSVVPVTGSGGVVLTSTTTPIILSQKISIKTSTSKLYFTGAAENKSPIVLKFLDEKGDTLHTSYTTQDSAYAEDILFSAPENVSRIQITLPPETSSTLQNLRIIPVFSAQKS